MRFPPAARCSGDFGPLIFLCSEANVVTACWHRAAGAWTIPRSDVALLFHISNAASLLAELEMASTLRQLCSASVRLLFLPCLRGWWCWLPPCCRGGCQVFTREQGAAVSTNDTPLTARAARIPRSHISATASLHRGQGASREERGASPGAILPAPPSITRLFPSLQRENNLPPFIHEKLLTALEQKYTHTRVPVRACFEHLSCFGESPSRSERAALQTATAEELGSKVSP